MKIVLTLFLLAFASLSHAQGLRLFSLGALSDGEDWQAVGRIDIAGEAFCTGALIAPDLVLTAAHCLYDPATRQPVALDQLQFKAGWRNGRASAYRYVSAAVHHPAYVFEASPGPERVSVDIALLRLQVPIEDPGIEPFAVDHEPGTGDRVERTCPDHMMILGRHDGGCVSSIEIVGGQAAPLLFELRGSEGSLRIDGHHPGGYQCGALTVTVSQGPEEPAQPAIPGLEGPAINVAQIYAQLDSDIRTGSRTVPDFEYAVRLTRLLDTIDAASDQGRTLPVPQG